MEHEKLSYVEALRWLAARYNIEVEETEQSPEVKQQVQAAESLYVINNFAQQFFSNTLFNTPEGQDIGLSYLHQSEFTNEVIQKFGIGYAADCRTDLTQISIVSQYK